MRPGVPVDRVAEASAELAPVFALLEDAEAEAQRVRANGREETARIRQQARERAEAIVADANARAGAVRADVVAEAWRTVEREAELVARSADEAAARLRERARERIPSLVDRAVSAALVALGEPPERVP
ncbi:V/A-type H+-transporting ATPase subunit E [Saccharopolyspora shandongensis]|uniref:V/A-type H+-transporting ATPase subunit E n=1 Tax=Saccharopolyspora shandongensis TaxID=418495 RepID=A0A1H3QXR3_9PSEU|nr:V/A-type H+-transporting ATPase subunit E [Saccharopolyspora shandongensis]